MSKKLFMSLMLFIAALFAWQDVVAAYCTMSLKMSDVGCKETTINNVHSHSLQALTIKVDGSPVLTQGATTTTFNWLSGSKSFSVKQGQDMEITFTNGAWSNSVWIGCDWNGDEDFEYVYDVYPTGRTDGGTQSVKTVTIKVPADAKIGATRIRFVSDGIVCEGQWDRTTPMCGTYGAGRIGYAGSVHDFGMNIEEGVKLSDLSFAESTVSLNWGDKEYTQVAASTNSEGAVTYTIKNPDDKPGLATVDASTGKVTFSASKSHGQSVITATQAAWGSYTETIATYTLNIKPNPDMDVFIAASPAEGGVASLLNGPWVQYGEPAQLKAVANSGYAFVNWTKDGVAVSTDADFTTEPVKTDGMTFTANFKKSALLIELDRKAWKSKACSEAKSTGEGPASYAIDGNNSTWWHTRYDGAYLGGSGPANQDMPAWIQFDMGSVQDIKAFNYVSRTGNALAANGNVTDYELWVSETTDISANISAWNAGYKPNVSANAVKVSEGKFDYTGGVSTSVMEHKVNLASAVKARYVYLLCKASIGSGGANKFANCAEFYLYEEEPSVKFKIEAAAAPAVGGDVTINGKVSPQEVGEGRKAVLLATAKPGYAFVNWTDASGTEVSTDSPYTIESVSEAVSLTANFIVSYPVMTYCYTNNLTQSNRYLKSVTATQGSNVTTVFDAKSEADLPRIDYDGVFSDEGSSKNGALIDRTATPIVIDEGATSFSLNFKAWKEKMSLTNILGVVEEKDSELDWTQNAIYIDWNKNYIFTDAGENYGKNSNVMPNAAFTSEAGYTKTITIPAGQAPGIYRMRVCYYEPANSQSTEKWNDDLFTTRGAKTRNAKSYDFAIEIKGAARESDLSFAEKTVSLNWGDKEYTQVATSTNSEGAVTYTIKNPDDKPGLATIDASTGKVTFSASKSYGQSVITATQAAWGSYTETIATYTLNIKINPDMDVFVAASPAEGGVASLLNGPWVQYGEPAQLKAVANSGYAFVNWTKDGVEVSTEANFTTAPIKTDGMTFTAVFVKKADTYTMKAILAPATEGVVTVNGSESPVEVDPGESVTFQVQLYAASKYKFVGWLKNGMAESDQNPYTVARASESLTLTALCELKKVVKVNVSVNNAELGSAVYTHTGIESDVYEGETVQFIATATSGSRFVNWTDADGNEVSTAFLYTVTNISAGISLKANFVSTQSSGLNFTNSLVNLYIADAEYTQAANDPNSLGGITYDISPATATIDANGKVMFSGAETYTITATQAASGKYAETTASYTLKVSANPKFRVSTTVTPAKSGMAYVNDMFGGWNVEYGQSAKLEAVPNLGYEFVKWVKDGKDVSTSIVYMTEPIKEAAEYVAVFDVLSGVSESDLADAKVWFANGALNINGIEAGDEIRVYATSGAILYNGIADGSSMTIDIAVGSGLYIVKINGTIFKATK